MIYAFVRSVSRSSCITNVTASSMLSLRHRTIASGELLRRGQRALVVIAK
jgi:hypothetical protein